MATATRVQTARRNGPARPAGTVTVSSTAQRTTSPAVRPSSPTATAPHRPCDTATTRLTPTVPVPRPTWIWRSHEVICSSCQTPGAARLPVDSRNRPRGGADPKPSKAAADRFPTAQNTRSASNGTSASTARRGPIGNATSHDRYGLPSRHSAYGTHCQPVRFMVTPTSASVNATVSDPASRRHSPPSRPQRSTGVERIHTARLLSMNGSSTSIDAVRTATPAVRVPHRYASTTTPAVAPPAEPSPSRTR